MAKIVIVCATADRPTFDVTPGLNGTSRPRTGCLARCSIRDLRGLCRRGLVERDRVERPSLQRLRSG